MNDNSETDAAYQARMTMLARKVSDVLEGTDNTEVAIICIRIFGFALGRMPLPKRDKVIRIATEVLKRAMIEGDASNTNREHLQ